MKTIIPNIKIEAIASWLPKTELELSSLAELYGAAEVESTIKVTGIERVRIADATMTSADMCQRAAEKILQTVDKSSIDGLVFVSQTPDYILPATAISLQHRLGLEKRVVCMDVHYGCSGYIYGLFTAASWIHCGMCERVLVLSGDTTSRMINPLDKSLRMVFGDCGTATLVARGTEPMGFNILSDGSGAEQLMVPAGGFRTPCSQATAQLTYDVDKNGRTQNDLYMDGVAIFNFAIVNVHRNINELLELVGWEKNSVALFCLHQANELMVNYLRKKLKVDAACVPVNVRNFGNTGPATLPLLLTDVAPTWNKPLHRVVLSGFGVGLSWGSVTLSLNGTNYYFMQQQ